MSSHHMYCTKCRQFVMAKDKVASSFHPTASGASKMEYECPLCRGTIVPSWEQPARHSYTPQEAKLLLLEADTPPDDILIGKKPWKLECTYTSRSDALGSAEMLDAYKLFKYPQGYALYERDYNYVD